MQRLATLGTLFCLLVALAAAQGDTGPTAATAGIQTVPEPANSVVPDQAVLAPTATTHADTTLLAANTTLISTEHKERPIASLAGYTGINALDTIPETGLLLRRTDGVESSETTGHVVTVSEHVPGNENKREHRHEHRHGHGYEHVSTQVVDNADDVEEGPAIVDTLEDSWESDMADNPPEPPLNEPLPTTIVADDHEQTENHSTTATVGYSPTPVPPPSLRRDAKALKDRFNYASADCAAVVLKSNREARGLTAILNTKKDQYMLNTCAARDKFVIVELCDDILIDTLVLGNYEFFSSTFKDTMVYVSDRYPPKNNTWTLLGHFQARNSRDAQVFPVVDPKLWARYVKVEFRSHYGREFYCPVTVLKVYGATQMEQFRKEEEEEEFLETATLTVDAVATPAFDYPFRMPYRTEPLGVGALPATSAAKAYLKDIQELVDEYEANEDGEVDSAPTAVPIPKVPDLPWGQRENEHTGADQDQGDDEGIDDEDEDEECDGVNVMCIYDSDDSDMPAVQETADRNLPPLGSGPAASVPVENNGIERPYEQPAARGPPRQESIFKTIMRRLSRVERNITLTYHYLEEQHLVFNMILQQVEMSNLEHLQHAIRQLNHTTMKQMQSLTMLSEEVWRAILYDIETHQQKTQSDMDSMSRRLEYLAEEVLFEKRMNLMQLMLLLTIVALIALNKVATKLALIPETKKEK